MKRTISPLFLKIPQIKNYFKNTIQTRFKKKYQNHPFKQTNFFHTV